MTNKRSIIEEEFVKKISAVALEKIIFTKKDKRILLDRIQASEEEIREELAHLKNLKHIEREVRQHKGFEEERYKLYFIYSNSKGRVYVIRFNGDIKIITCFPLGRHTLNKYRKKMLKKRI